MTGEPSGFVAMISPIIAHQRRMIACDGQIVHAVIRAPAQHGEERVAVRIEEDRVVRDARFLQERGELGPEGVVPAPILVRLPGSSCIVKANSLGHRGLAGSDAPDQDRQRDDGDRAARRSRPA